MGLCVPSNNVKAKTDAFPFCLGTVSAAPDSQNHHFLTSAANLNPAVSAKLLISAVGILESGPFPQNSHLMCRASFLGLTQLVNTIQEDEP